MKPRTLTFDACWCPTCKLPRAILDITFPYKCTCPGQAPAKSKVINAKAPIGFNSGFAPQQWVGGISCLVFDSAEVAPQLIGYAFFYEIDYGLMHAWKHRAEAIKLADLVASVTGTCVLLRSIKGWHMPSISVVPFETFRKVAKECESLAPSDHRYLVLRVTRKSDEHTMPRFYGYFEHDMGFPISSWHKGVWELASKMRPLPTTLPEIATSGQTVNYISWS